MPPLRLRRVLMCMNAKAHFFGIEMGSNVGGGLLPIAVDQLQMHQLTISHRGQAPSHI